MLKATFNLLTDLAAGFVAFFKAQWSQYNTVGQFLFVLAIAAIANDAAISYQYGKSMTTLHAIGFAIVAISFCVLPDIANKAWSDGNRKAGGWLMVACIPLGVVAYQSHIGYGAGVRLGDIQQTGFQHAKLETATTALKSEVANNDMWRKQLADLEAQAALPENAWFATVTATGLRAQLASADKAIELETKRGGCKAKCLALMQDKAKIEGRIATLETRDDLKKRIEATQRIIDKKGVVVADTGYASSTVVNQNDTFAKLWNLYNGVDGETAIKPTAVQRDVANTAMAGFASLAFMLCGPLLMLAAGINRIRNEHAEEITRQAKAHMAASVPVTHDSKPASGPANTHTHEVIVMQDKDPRLDPIARRIAAIQAWGNTNTVAA